MTSVPFAYFRPADGAALFGRNKLGLRYYDQPGATVVEGSDDYSFRPKYHKGSSGTATYPCPCCPTASCGTTTGLGPTIYVSVTVLSGSGYTPLVKRPLIKSGSGFLVDWTSALPIPGAPEYTALYFRCLGGGTRQAQVNFADSSGATATTFTVTNANNLFLSCSVGPGTPNPGSFMTASLRFDFFREP